VVCIPLNKEILLSTKEKIIPRQIFRLNNENLAFFLRHLWATDGTIFVPKKDKSASKIAFSTNK
jgi:replicative DNA helicase